MLTGFTLGLFLGAPSAAHALRGAWADPLQTAIERTSDIYLRQCKLGDPIREWARPMTLDGYGHTIRQTCFEKRVLRQDCTGYQLLKPLLLPSPCFPATIPGAKVPLGPTGVSSPLSR